MQECNWVALFLGHQGQPCWFLVLQGFCPWSWARDSMVQVLGKEAEVRLRGQRGQGAGDRPQVWILCPWEGGVDVGFIDPWEP